MYKIGSKFYLKIMVLSAVLIFSFAPSAFAVDSANLQLTIEDVAECNDDFDNDGDGLIDYPEDLGCESLEDNSEQQDTVVVSGAVSEEEFNAIAGRVTTLEKRVNWLYALTIIFAIIFAALAIILFAYYARNQRHIRSIQNYIFEHLNATKRPLTSRETKIIEDIKNIVNKLK